MRYYSIRHFSRLKIFEIVVNNYSGKISNVIGSGRKARQMNSFDVNIMLYGIILNLKAIINQYFLQIVTLLNKELILIVRFN